MKRTKKWNYLLIITILFQIKITSQSIISSIQQSSTKQQTCDLLKYTTSSTRCEIQLNNCSSASTNSSNQMKFVSCFKIQCSRYVRGSECRLENKLTLDQNKCYRECCGALNFTRTTCDSYNQFKQTSQQNSQGIIIAIIVISSIILLVVAAILLIKVQKCLKKDKYNAITHKYPIAWRQDQYTQTKCEICGGHGALLVTSCMHYFHVQCFKQQVKQKNMPFCPKCDMELQNRTKLYCSYCRSMSYKFKLQKVKLLQGIIIKAKNQHEDLCYMSTKSDSRLLQPST